MSPEPSHHLNIGKCHLDAFAATVAPLMPHWSTADIVRAYQVLSHFDFPSKLSYIGLLDFLILLTVTAVFRSCFSRYSCADSDGFRADIAFVRFDASSDVGR
jgi:hypothetical protein